MTTVSIIFNIIIGIVDVGIIVECVKILKEIKKNK